MVSYAEEWRAIANEPGYEVSSLGRVRVVGRSTGRGRYSVVYSERIRKPHLSRGYYRLYIGAVATRRRYSVHRLVAEAFVPNPLGKSEVNHKNKVRTDNRSVNLEWVTAAENNEHKREFHRLKYREHLAMLAD